MLILLLGADGFSKQQYIDDLAAKEKTAPEFFNQPESLPLGQMASRDLFGGKKLYVVGGGIKFLDGDNLPSLINSGNLIVFLEEKLDKRLKFNKDLLANKSVTVKEFALPHGSELDRWIIDRVTTSGASISQFAAGELAVRLGRDNAKETKFGGKVVDTEEVYNLQQADSEIQKLTAYAAGREISADDVKALVSENGEVDVFDLTNAIAENQKLRAMQLLHGFLRGQTGADEKGSVIQLNALLSEQFRNVAVVQDFTARKLPEAEILELTGWKSGRLFVMKKIANRFPQKKVLETLTKLEALDEELKSSTTPPKVLLDLIVSQLLT